MLGGSGLGAWGSSPTRSLPRVEPWESLWGFSAGPGASGYDCHAIGFAQFQPQLCRSRWVVLGNSQTSLGSVPPQVVPGIVRSGLKAWAFWAEGLGSSCGSVPH